MINQNIYIVGAGAIGKVLAVFLTLEGKDVTILRGSIDNERKHTEKIVIELKNAEKIESEIEVSTISNISIIDGIAILTNKSYGNQDLSEKLENKIGNSPIILLQNGLNIEKTFVDKNFPEIYRCVLFATSQPIIENKFKFKPVSVSPIGTIRGNTGHLLEIVERMNTSYFQFRADHTIQPIIWTKTIINSVFNSVCPLLESDNGIFHRNEMALNIAKRIVSECVSIAEKAGVSLNIDDVMENLLLISRFSDGQLISTYQDIISKRRTEIDTLNFAIVEIAKELGEEKKTKETQLLGELTKLKSIIARQ